MKAWHTKINISLLMHRGASVIVYVQRTMDVYTEASSGGFFRRNNPVATMSVVLPTFHPNCFDDIDQGD